MAVIDGFQLIETIKDFTFREQGGIKILKEWRELAIICQVDIEIVSVSRQNYRNYGSLPAHGFYGYVSLVTRDFISEPIPIKQARQTLYYGRNDSAIANWFNYLQQIRVQENFKGIEALVCFNTGLLGGSCAPKPCKPIPKFSFDEFPLREVLVKTFYGTQFKIEYSFWKLNDELDNCGEIIIPKSKQTDGDKDNGLPENGTAPQNGNPSNPYDGLPPADNESKAGIIPLSKLNGIDNPNPDNDLPTATTPVTWLITLSFSPPNANDGCGIFRPAGEVRSISGLYGDSWTFPDCNPRSGYNGFCFFRNGVYESESYICNPSVVVFDSILAVRNV